MKPTIIRNEMHKGWVQLRIMYPDGNGGIVTLPTAIADKIVAFLESTGDR
jgi:hypothetical protein